MATYLMGEEARNKIFDDASRIWGEIPQVHVAVEELAELIQATCKHFFRGKSIEESGIIGELADAQIMIDQLIRLLPGDIDQEVSNMIDYKLNRTKKRLVMTVYAQEQQ